MEEEKKKSGGRIWFQGIGFFAVFVIVFSLLGWLLNSFTLSQVREDVKQPLCYSEVKTDFQTVDHHQIIMRSYHDCNELK